MQDPKLKGSPRSTATEAVDKYFAVLDTIQSRPTSSRKKVLAPKIDINDEIAREQKIKNDNAEQDIRLKKDTLNRLFLFLGIETAVIFGFALLQGGRWFGFELDDVSFRILLSATILQITGMLFVAVRYLFPIQDSKK